MTTVIHAEGLSKRYRRGTRVDAGLRHVLEDFARSPWRALRGAKPEAFWALKDVSLQVQEGEVLGLIGRNGAGKTTLLKILSRITRPTEGWAEIRGRVRSLLEVGTGFHPELTGRENAYLSGAILGMTKSEITRKFDEIIAFAEIDKFVDTPVKHYSSGMYMRLAFSVAAHLEPEILLVDEVLAVGDINFQKKCLGKMGEVAKAGRTVVLVSHQLNQIRRLCQRVAWVDAGTVRKAGPTHEVVSAYESAMAATDETPDLARVKDRPGASAKFVRWELFQNGTSGVHTLSKPGPVTIKFTLKVWGTINEALHGMALYSHEQQLLLAPPPRELRLSPGEYQFCHTFPMLPLRPGPYSWLATLYDEANDEVVDWCTCVPDMIVATENYQAGYDEWNGILNLPASFETLST